MLSPQSLQNLPSGSRAALRRLAMRAGVDVSLDPLTKRMVKACRHLGVDTVVDVGANKGQFARLLRAAGWKGRIVSIEPLPGEFQLMSSHFRSDASWYGLNVAIGAEEGAVQLHVAGNSHSSSVLAMTTIHEKAAPGSAYVDAINVRQRTLDNVFAELDLVPAQTLLKLDVQGFEQQALQGASSVLRTLRMLQMEVSLAPLYAGQVLADELLASESLGRFRTWGLQDGFADRRTGRSYQYDVLLVAEADS